MDKARGPAGDMGLKRRRSWAIGNAEIQASHGVVPRKLGFQSRAQPMVMGNKAQPWG